MRAAFISFETSLSSPTSISVSPCPSGSSLTSAAFGLGAAQPGRSSNRSGLAIHSMSSGAFWANVETYSIRSSIVGSAQWMSSKTTISGSLRAIASNSLRKPQAISSEEAASSVVPTAAAIREAASSDSASSPSAERVSPSSETISESGQYVIPSP